MPPVFGLYDQKEDGSGIHFWNYNCGNRLFQAGLEPLACVMTALESSF